jgi:YHS domain-containing protein
MMRQAWMLLVSAIILTQVASAQPEKRKKEFNLTKASLAIQGYDPVAYFTQNKAVEGRSSFSLQHEGVVYYFSTAQNRDVFQAAPARYEPQYGGWCAYAMGVKGEKVPVDPETFKISDGKLFLFYNRFFNNTLKLWNKEEKALHDKADANWSKIYSKP